MPGLGRWVAAAGRRALWGAVGRCPRRAEEETGSGINNREGFSRRSAMPEVKSTFREVLPKQGQLSVEDVPTMVLCKPKLLPLKSVTLEKLEKMQQEVIKQQEVVLREQQPPQPEQERAQ